ncbi:MAG: hypothetical protein GXP42_05705 [Chloroflexi bacterium]|nr:hypothetical protein [Chloroflexota bacterium]
MKGQLSRLAARIRDEVSALERVSQRVTEGWRRTLTSGDDYYLDGVALNLHGYYSGLERIFGLIAAIVDQTKPSGANWHQALLAQMTKEVPDVRPAVISHATFERLNEYRGFRHVVRNIYTYNFELAKIKALVINLPATHERVTVELLAFADFLEHRSREGEG